MEIFVENQYIFIIPHLRRNCNIFLVFSASERKKSKVIYDSILYCYAERAPEKQLSQRIYRVALHSEYAGNTAFNAHRPVSCTQGDINRQQDKRGTLAELGGQ